MYLLVAWLAIFLISIKSLVKMSRRSYRTRTQDNSRIFSTIVFSILAHMSFIHFLYIEAEGWISWLFPLMNIMFVVQVLLISDLVLDNYQVFAKAQVINDKVLPILFTFSGVLALLYLSVYVDDAVFTGLCVITASIGMTGQLITYKNVK